MLEGSVLDGGMMDDGMVDGGWWMVDDRRWMREASCLMVLHA